MTEREHLKTFLTAIDASPTALERPVYRGWVGDYQINGKHGHVLSDHPGYLLYVTGTIQRWKKTTHLLPGKVSQKGDDEGILRLDRLPTAAEAELIRDLIGIRKRRHMTAKALSNLERARGSTKSPNIAPELALECEWVPLCIGRPCTKGRFSFGGLISAGTWRTMASACRSHILKAASDRGVPDDQ